MLLFSGLLWMAACSSAPEIEPVPDVVEDLREAGFFEPPPEDRVGRDAAELEVVELEHQDITGGGIWFTIARPPEEVEEALLDFERAAGHRSWAESFEVLERSQGRVVARWFFEGKMGVNPQPVLAFETERLPDRTIIRYRLLESAFGLAAFFGDYQVLSSPTSADRSIVGERVYIDSGLFFVGASPSDIAEGLREDVRRLREWLGDRQ